jgi:hypothetical protein
VDVDVDELRFDRPIDFDPRRHLAGSFFGVFHAKGEPVVVRIAFDAAAARYVSEYRFHETQRIASTGEGNLIVEFRLTAMEELRAWVLGFGRHAVVLEPPELRRAVAEELCVAAANRTSPYSTILSRTAFKARGPNSPTGRLPYIEINVRSANRTSDDSEERSPFALL